MAAHNDTGKKGEELAATFFTNNGYTLLEKNWRTGHMEVDIIAAKNGMLHFIEVKCRSTKKFGKPEENVSRNKIKLLIDASAEYLHKNPEWQKIQFDVLAITLHPSEPDEYFLIEDVYL